MDNLYSVIPNKARMESRHGKQYRWSIPQRSKENWLKARVDSIRRDGSIKLLMHMLGVHPPEPMVQNICWY